MNDQLQFWFMSNVISNEDWNKNVSYWIAIILYISLIVSDYTLRLIS